VTVGLDGLVRKDVVACKDRVEGEDGALDCGFVVVSISSADSVVDLVGKASLDMQRDAVREVFCEVRVGVPVTEGLVTDHALELALAKMRGGET
jgi:hypothetical protein